MALNVTELIEAATTYEPVFTNGYVVQFFNGYDEVKSIPSYQVSGWTLDIEKSLFKKSVLYVSLKQSRDVFITKADLEKVDIILLTYIDRQHKVVATDKFTVKLKSIESSGDYSDNGILNNIVCYTIKKVSSDKINNK